MKIHLYIRNKSVIRRNIIKNRGFTLIELLVVIAVIGLIATIVLVSLNSARQKARDARRLNDVKQISLALQIYKNENGTFPSNAGCRDGWCCLGHGDAGTCWAGGYTGKTALDNDLAPYIKNLPDDPLNNTSRNGDAYMYGLYALTDTVTLHWGIENCSPTAAKDCLGGYLGNWGGGSGNGCGYYCFWQIK